MKDFEVKKNKRELVISKIKEGTVIDHISAGKALLVLKILGIDERTRETISLAMNVPSKKMGKKDIVKVENKFINEEELNKIALIAPNATINLIKDYEIVKKFKVKLPEVVEGIILCPNKTCISNAKREPIKSRFYISVKDGEVAAKCHYCGKVLKNIAEHLL
ncbi:MAG: aspartate carbamoyltransferase regulatory subunit [Archaeoglobaceae archaeon]|nr:aspartate carbamoyltransferase regulatory subunit [Archaeoglobaceae archaeon]MCX8151924.1 aspartate carbamoyltransferase regulatory subunit [Archaeoglobaceae archaeon]MDW8013313.1 aspartate carbamoyltransferase regulatory subunit [Archaeoglobaceae archaeon]